MLMWKIVERSIENQRFRLYIYRLSKERFESRTFCVKKPRKDQVVLNCFKGY